jgi:murein L,D-transpeptidase YcbB/YkuD
MFSGNEKFVKVKAPVPDFIIYYTAWVDESGLLNYRDDIYRDDIYRRDAILMQKMFRKIKKPLRRVIFSFTEEFNYTILIMVR